MDDKLKSYFRSFVWNSEKASNETISEFIANIDFSVPIDYMDLMRIFNGGDGEIGEYAWLCLFPIEDLILFNKANELLMSQIPDYFLFGKDAADTGYAFHKKGHTFHSFGLMSNFKTDPIEDCGNSFTEFIQYLHNQE